MNSNLTEKIQCPWWNDLCRITCYISLFVWKVARKATESAWCLTLISQRIIGWRIEMISRGHCSTMIRSSSIQSQISRIKDRDWDHRPSLLGTRCKRRNNRNCRLDSSSRSWSLSKLMRLKSPRSAICRSCSSTTSFKDPRSRKISARRERSLLRNSGRLSGAATDKILRLY